jgi:hypothetical protein
MQPSQFRVLYWQSLFRVVDLDLLSASAQGDSSKLLGQLAGILIYISLIIAFAGLISDLGHMPPAQKLAATWAVEQFLISTTMLVVGLFAVLSWEAMFPDRRDVMVLAPLPIRSRTLFLAKAAAVTAALLVAVAALNGAPSLIWPILLARSNSGVVGVIQSFAAYSLTMLAAGAFTFCSLLCAQGLAALLPRQQFLRMSSLMQTMAFCVLVGGYFLQPMMLRPQALTAARNQTLLAWTPSYWFWGLFQRLNGAGDPSFAMLTWRALIGLAITILGAAGAFLLSYLRTLRKIAEEPDILPAARSRRWLPRLGHAPLTAIVQFNVRTLFRSRQHRLTLAFFFGLAFAVAVLCLKGSMARGQLAGPNSWQETSVPVMAASIVMMLLVVTGVRAAFAMPTDLRANWVFRTANFVPLAGCLKATRRSLLALAVVPVCMIWGVALFRLWPWRSAAEHLAFLALLGTILVEAGLYGFHKIPFTCSYLPGKPNVYVLFLIFGPLVVMLLIRIVHIEQNALRSAVSYSVMGAAMIFAAAGARWGTTALARSEGAALRFEEIEDPVIGGLDLHKDGILTIEPRRE